MGARWLRGRRSNGNGRVQASNIDCPPLAAPSELEASTFEVGGDEYAVFAFNLPDLKPPADLSRAEREVVRAAAGGCSNAEIAKGRGTSARTVANQLRSIYSKLGIASRVELVRFCSRSLFLGLACDSYGLSARVEALVAI